MDNFGIQHLVQSWISTIFGVALMVFSALFFYQNMKSLTLENILIGAALAAVGFIFLFVKDELITKLVTKKITGE